MARAELRVQLLLLLLMMMMMLMMMMHDTNTGPARSWWALASTHSPQVGRTTTEAGKAQGTVVVMWGACAL